MTDVKSVQNILFDLDGTIIDSGQGVTNAVRYALKKFGIDVGSPRELYGFMGPPLSASFPKFYNFTAEQTEEAIKYYREYYSEKGIFEFKLYDGIKELITELTQAGKIIYVATTKPEPFSRKIIKKSGLAHLIKFVGGSTFDGTMENKADIIKYVLDMYNIRNNENCIMIGDRMYDIQGAAENKISSIGILYGYGNREELENSGAEYIAETVSDLRNLLI